MRLIKERTSEYESFHKSLQYFTKKSEVKGDLRLINFEAQNTRSDLLEKYSFFINNLSAFHKKIQKTKNISELNLLFQEYVKRILNAKEVEVFLFVDSQRHLIPISRNAASLHVNTVNKIYKDGILDWVFESRKPTIIPDLNSDTINGSKLNQFIFPIYYTDTNYGLVSIMTSLSKISEDSLESNSINVLLGIIIPMIISFRQKESINKLYHELQIYQSKMQNDFDVYAIGELAEGILEEIGEPLQVIMSLTDMLETENKKIDKQVTSNIKNQIKKVSELTNRLSKFSELNKPKLQKAQSCNLNKLVREFKNIINTSLQNLGLECELDLEENIPPILGDPKEIKQLLTSVFSLLKSASNKGGAFIIQTKYVKEQIVVSVFTTEQIESLSDYTDNRTNVNINFIKEIMKRSEGSAEFNSLPLKGTIIHLVFPLKRKLAI